MGMTIAGMEIRKVKNTTAAFAMVAEDCVSDRHSQRDIMEIEVTDVCSASHSRQDFSQRCPASASSSCWTGKSRRRRAGALPRPGRGGSPLHR
jgi:hypothetical protein